MELKGEPATHAVQYSFYLKNRITDRQTLIIQTWTLGKCLLGKELNETHSETDRVFCSDKK